MRIFVILGLIAGLAGCDSLPPLEDIDREKEFAELDALAEQLQASGYAARRAAKRQARAEQSAL